MKTQINEYRKIYNQIQDHKLLSHEELVTLLQHTDFTGDFGQKIRQEIIPLYRKCEHSDCEYTTYVNQLSILIWCGKTCCESFKEMMSFEF